MGMHGESVGRGDQVIVDDTQGSKADMGRVVVGAEGEGVTAVEAPDFGVTAFLGAPDLPR